MCKEPNSEQSTLFAGDRPASPSAQPESVAERMMIAGSGTRLCALLEPSNPAGSVSKILLASQAWGSPECFLRWRILDTAPPDSETGRPSFLRFRLRPAGWRTIGSECGLWPTPRVGGDGGKAEHSDLSGQVETAIKGLWATPSARDYKDTGDLSKVNRTHQETKKGRMLPRQVQAAMWPTPTTMDHIKPRTGKALDYILRRGKEGANKTTLCKVPEAVHYALNPDGFDALGTDGSAGCPPLNPAFSLWLMGFPSGWLD